MAAASSFYFYPNLLGYGFETLLHQRLQTCVDRLQVVDSVQTCVDCLQSVEAVHQVGLLHLLLLGGKGVDKGYGGFHVAFRLTEERFGLFLEFCLQSGFVVERNLGVDFIDSAVVESFQVSWMSTESTT